MLKIKTLTTKCTNYFMHTKFNFRRKLQRHDSRDCWKCLPRNLSFVGGQEVRNRFPPTLLSSKCHLLKNVAMLGAHSMHASMTNKSRHSWNGRHDCASKKKQSNSINNCCRLGEADWCRPSPVLLSPLETARSQPPLRPPRQLLGWLEIENLVALAQD